MAEALGIESDRYKKYETRTPMPHWLIARFCLLTDSEPAELLAVDKVGKPRATPKKAS